MLEFDTDVLVIGAGQAGLAAGFHLKRAGFDFRILEKAERLGASWRQRYESLTLFTPRAFSALPGLTMPGDPDGYPSRDEFAGYLEAYASSHGLPVTFGCHVVSLTKEAHGFRVALDDGLSMRSRNIVVATGGFQKSLRSQVSAGFDGSVPQLDPETYRNPDSVPPGRVLVVRDGASGRDIATELSATREVWLATGKPRKLFPERILGKSVWWWLDRLGLMRASPASSAWDAQEGSVPGSRGQPLGTCREGGANCPEAHDRRRSAGNVLRRYHRRGRCCHLGDRLPGRLCLDQDFRSPG